MVAVGGATWFVGEGMHSEEVSNSRLAYRYMYMYLHWTIIGIYH